MMVHFYNTKSVSRDKSARALPKKYVNLARQDPGKGNWPVKQEQEESASNRLPTLCGSLVNVSNPSSELTSYGFFPLPSFSIVCGNVFSADGHIGNSSQSPE